MAPATHPRGHGLASHDRPAPHRPRPRRCGAGQTTQVVLHPLRRGTPNECWQADFTHYRLTHPDGRPGADIEILCWIDDHFRYALRVTAHRRVTGPTVLHMFRETVAKYGISASTLTDNGMVFTTRLSGGSQRGTRDATA
ncbi:DDE-type integrase/transposase/recombinase [Actinoplanes sp. TRM 88003]|uniref:DDE-type integrase/transposase/recombinase n=1 Tax=Paractinoplanes aksuensis TaxID=2939490 RepID=A0ABT1DL18_9ACTN|nr:DDE-type integrase/transposase/recombinase [Actinoplanes aksuensis]MCO8271542.1 DDE-type integrase/transposase/recombinase [Actinoplanes aksuensis]